MSQTRRRADAALFSTAPFTRILGISLVSSKMQVADEPNTSPRCACVCVRVCCVSLGGCMRARARVQPLCGNGLAVYATMGLRVHVHAQPRG